MIQTKRISLSKNRKALGIKKESLGIPGFCQFLRSRISIYFLPSENLNFEAEPLWDDDLKSPGVDILR